MEPSHHPLSYLPVLHTGRWFSALEPSFAGHLLALAQPRRLEPGQALFLRGDALEGGLFAVVQGSIGFSGVGGQGEHAREALLTRMGPATWFGEIALFDGSPRTHDAHAMEPSIVLQLPRQPLLDWLHQHPAHWHDLGVLMSGRMRAAFAALEDLALLPAPQRLVRRLVAMARGYGERLEAVPARPRLQVTQEQLARMLSISRQTVNTLLQGLQARGIIRVQRGEIEILQWQALCDERF
ncbi:Cyclic AMP receptor-like protein [Delftia tsuruhatensis]|uniref:Crp/Fnr family transcriptional regulator n=1 Tax=Delftia tsuruhatensis TaxID=180282 RepID=UPI001E7F1826|nr:Crp/Fnr family transcriptional regulator [Delftia tsuruhatensis]CAB5700018.1 Cyclic AMP receptor-like protein [Delftia tsuruhatensis]CAC9693586.1 Cyclic AMP receptor-like protein [Delftia tsuruhatensis]